MGKTKLDKLYENAWNYMRKNQRKELGLDDQVYINILTEVYPMINRNPLYCDDVMMMCVDRFLAEDIEKEKLEEGRVEFLIKTIKNTLELNKRVHYLLIPIDGAQLGCDISFGDYSFINGTEEDIEKKVIKITGISDEKIHDFLEHTKKSRSKDFLKYPMLVMRIDNLNTNVYNNASFTAQRIFQILKLMIYNKETELTFYEMASNWFKDNYHVAIVGEESWQYGHRNWWNLIQCKYELDFLLDKENQELFEKLVRYFVWTRDRDELGDLFANALELFERSLEQHENYRDTTLSLLLLFSAAESLLTEGKNEKKLRLSVIWPRLINIKGKKQKELGVLVRDAYDLRNNFVHAGNMIYLEEKVKLRVLHQMLAKLILKYFDSSEWDNMPTEEEKKSNKWNKYVNGIFTDAIYN